MSTQIELLKADIARLEARLEESKRKLAKIEAESSNGAEVEAAEFPLNAVSGILKGRVTFSEDDIQAAKIQPRDLE